MTQLNLFDWLPAGGVSNRVGALATAVPVTPAPWPTFSGSQCTAGEASAEGEPQSMGRLAHVVIARYEMFARRKAAMRARETRVGAR
jgi:hypothetical protein